MSWDDIAAKADRARHHLKVFNRFSSRFLKSDECGILNDFNSEPGYILVKAFSNSTPPKLYSILLGELLYHMRSALDYTACQLTEDNNGTVDSDVEFPIWVGRSGAAGFGELGDKRAWNFPRIGQMDMAKQIIIQDEQPFNGKYGSVDDDPLTWLYHLANFDRHRFLHVTTAAVREGFTRIEPAIAKARLREVGAYFGPIERETEILRYRILPGPEVEMKVHASVRIDIAFGEGGPLAGSFVNYVIGSIGVRVFELIERLKPPDLPRF